MAVVKEIHLLSDFPRCSLPFSTFHLPESIDNVDSGGLLPSNV